MQGRIASGVKIELWEFLAYSADCIIEGASGAAIHMNNE